MLIYLVEYHITYQNRSKMCLEKVLHVDFNLVPLISILQVTSDKPVK